MSNKSCPRGNIVPLSIYHSKQGNFIKRGEIVGLPATPQYVPSDNELVDFKNPKEMFYQIKVKDETTGNIHVSSVKLCQMVASEWNDEFICIWMKTMNFIISIIIQRLMIVKTKSSGRVMELTILVSRIYKTIYNQYKGGQTQQEFKSTRLMKERFKQKSRPLLGNFESQAKKQQNTQKPTVNVNNQAPEMKELEEKSFFQKYWAYILFGVMMLLTMGGDNSQAAPPTRR
ncbi:unnamed protein product [Rhizopus stolonifer]